MFTHLDFHHLQSLLCQNTAESGLVLESSSFSFRAIPASNETQTYIVLEAFEQSVAQGVLDSDTSPEELFAQWLNNLSYRGGATLSTAVIWALKERWALLLRQALHAAHHLVVQSQDDLLLSDVKVDLVLGKVNSDTDGVPLLTVAITIKEKAFLDWSFDPRLDDVKAHIQNFDSALERAISESMGLKKSHFASRSDSALYFEDHVIASVQMTSQDVFMCKGTFALNSAESLPEKLSRYIAYSVKVWPLIESDSFDDPAFSEEKEFKGLLNSEAWFLKGPDGNKRPILVPVFCTDQMINWRYRSQSK